jgi:hypothetical protein
MSAYTDDKPFSVGLVGAVSVVALLVPMFHTESILQVLRQGSFVKKMADLRWAEPSFFEAKEDGVVLQHAVARYHA